MDRTNPGSAGAGRSGLSGNPPKGGAPVGKEKATHREVGAPGGGVGGGGGGSYQEEVAGKKDGPANPPPRLTGREITGLRSRCRPPRSLGDASAEKLLRISLRASGVTRSHGRQIGRSQRWNALERRSCQAARARAFCDRGWIGGLSHRGRHGFSHVDLRIGWQPTPHRHSPSVLASPSSGNDCRHRAFAGSSACVERAQLHIGSRIARRPTQGGTAFLGACSRGRPACRCKTFPSSPPEEYSHARAIREGPTAQHASYAAEDKDTRKRLEGPHERDGGEALRLRQHPSTHLRGIYYKVDVHSRHRPWL